MNVSLDTDIVIHLYLSEKQELIFDFFDEIYMHEYLFETELRRKSPVIYREVTADVEKGIIEIVTNKDLASMGIKGIFETFEREIEDLNTNALIKYIEEAVKCYEEKTVERIIETVGYKKSTLASLRNVLDFFNVENSIDQYLKGISKYKAIDMKGMYDAAL